jgi:MOSC domain-containing protein YiiM
MFAGTLKAIFISADPSEAMKQVDMAEAIAGTGLAQDRYATGKGSFSKPLPDREVTFIEIEAIEGAENEYEFKLSPEETRRNLLTEGVPLNHLVDKEFTVGGVRFRGIRLCEPCGHLEKLLNKPVVKALRHRGGLRAQIVSSGTLNAGDEIRID